VFAAGLLAIAAVAARAAGSMRAAEAGHSARVAVLSVVDSLVQVEHPTSGAVARGPHLIRWVATDSSATTRLRVSVRYPNGSLYVTDSLIAAAAAWPGTLSRVP